jgi:hypothetical protein
MTIQDKKLLIGSLSNDLYRVANLSHKGSMKAAERFFTESQRWTTDLEHLTVKKHIRKIIQDLGSLTVMDLTSQETAEKLLMYSILLQNYSLHLV